MPPRVRAQLCNCTVHGCANADRTSNIITGRVLKGRYLSDMEFRAHQRDEKSARRSARNPLLGPTEDLSGTAHAMIHPLPSPDPPAISEPKTGSTQQLPLSEEAVLDSISPNTLPLQMPLDALREDSGPENSPSYATSHYSVDQTSPQSHDKGGPAAGQGNTPTNTLPRRIMQAIESCRLDFQSLQRADIPCDELVFEETIGKEEPQPRIPLRVDIMSNAEFIEYEAVMFTLLDRIDKIETGAYDDCKVARQNVLSSIEDEIDRLRGIKLHVWNSQSTNGPSGSAVPLSGPFREIDTGMVYYESTATVYLTIWIGPYFALIRDDIHPVILATYVIVAVMLVISGTSESTCGFLLKGLSVVAELCLSSTGSSADSALTLLRGIGTDSRRVIKALKLTPDARSYVCCPKCYACYPQTSEDSYPDKCYHKKTPSSTECGCKLRKVRTVKNIQHSVPVRRFIYHEFKEWLGEMLCHPGMEDMLDRDVSPSQDGVMHDIWDAPELHNLVGSDGKPFIRRDGSEGRYVFSFCMDGFNPFHLKQAGKKASVVAMYMICLNLPPEERYKLENMFLVGIIPGPHEPKKEEINHLLSPLVDDLLDSYHHGVWYSRTQNYERGRYARSVLVLVVCDTPASRQVTGRISATSTHFCPYCNLSNSEITNTDPKTWHLRTDVEHRTRANEWLQASTEGDRDDLFTCHGVRYSELLRLPYWSPIRHTVVDSMHLFFLILFKRHCRDIWGMDSNINDGDGTTADPVSSKLLSSVEVQNAFVSLRREPLGKLSDFKTQTLNVLANARGCYVKGNTSKSTILGILSGHVSDNGVQVIPLTEGVTAPEDGVV